MRLTMPELGFSENIWAFISIVFPCQTRSFVLEINTGALAKEIPGGEWSSLSPALWSHREARFQLPPEHLAVWEMMGPAAHRSCSSPLSFHGALRQCRPRPVWGYRLSGDPSSPVWGGLRHRQRQGLALVMWYQSHVRCCKRGSPL